MTDLRSSTEIETAGADIGERIGFYLDDAPMYGGHSDKAGGTCWELLREAQDEIAGLREANHHYRDAAQGAGDCGARDAAKHLQEQLDLSVLENQRLLTGLATINNYLCENPPRVGDATFDCEALLASVEPWPDALARPTQCGDKGEAVAWIAFAGNGNVRFWTSDPNRSQREKERGLDLRAFTMAELIALVSRLPAPQPASNAYTAKQPADEMIGEIEKRFPDWKSYRDLVDCIDVTLHRLRGGS